MKTFILTAILVSLCLQAYSQATNTQQGVVNDSQLIALHLYLPQAPAESIKEKVEVKFLERTQHLFEENLHPLRTGFWFVEREIRLEQWKSGGRLLEDRSDFVTRKSEKMFGIIGDSFGDAIRESVVDLPIITWVEDIQENVGRFLEGSIGETVEEEIEPLSNQYSSSGKKWYRRVLLDGMSYGVRPFSDRPYAYVGFKPWHFDETDVLVHLRYYPKNIDRHSVEAVTSFVFPGDCSLNLGMRYAMDGRDYEYGVSGGLHKRFGKNKTLFISGNMDRRDSGVFAGFHASF